MDQQPPARVKNKGAAALQITAEQLLREAHERHDQKPKLGRQRILDETELNEFRFHKRKQFEDTLRMNSVNYGVWVKYAQWEETQKEFDRARSIYERALNVDPRNQRFWSNYIEMESRHAFIQHARNLYDRVVTLLPRVDQFWSKYAYMEELLGNIEGSRLVFERWMAWEPSEQAWNLYIKFEKRYKEKDRVRALYARLVRLHPYSKNWLRWTSFEEDSGCLDHARNVYQQAIDTLGSDFAEADLFIAFARFEARLKEVDRARSIYTYALQRLPDHPQILAAFSTFEKQHGDGEQRETALLARRRTAYEDAVAQHPYDYDHWFDYLRLEEAHVEQTLADPSEAASLQGEEAISQCRSLFERAVIHVPPVEEKSGWRRYIYLWIKFALFEELTAVDVEKTRSVYVRMLDVVPHQRFTFAKCWLMYAQFEIRQLQITTARKLLGRALGVCPKPKLYRGYIELELQLREFDRCRKLYEGFLKYDPALSYAWIKYAELETLLDEIQRARALYNLAVAQSYLDMPELVWKAYIDFEVGHGQVMTVRSVYRRLLDRSVHPKVWNSFAEFEMTQEAGGSGDDALESARSIWREGHSTLKERQLAEERRLLLELWIAFEEKYEQEGRLGECESIVEKLRQKLPQAVKKRRRLNADDPSDTTMEEYIDYIFPEDEEEAAKKRGMGGLSKLLAKARAWKESQHE